MSKILDTTDGQYTQSGIKFQAQVSLTRLPCFFDAIELSRQEIGMALPVLTNRVGVYSRGADGSYWVHSLEYTQLGDDFIEMLVDCGSEITVSREDRRRYDLLEGVVMGLSDEEYKLGSERARKTWNSSVRDSNLLATAVGAQTNINHVLYWTREFERIEFNHLHDESLPDLEGTFLVAPITACVRKSAICVSFSYRYSASMKIYQRVLKEAEMV